MVDKNINHFGALIFQHLHLFVVASNKIIYLVIFKVSDYSLKGILIHQSQSVTEP